MADSRAVRVSRHRRMASHATSTAVTSVAKMAPARTPKLFAPNNPCPMLLIQYPAMGFSK